MQEAMDSVVDWANTNYMRINELKTKEMLLHFKRKPIDLPAVLINSCAIERVNSFKILGLWVSCDLTWDTHINKTVSKASQRLYLLRLLKRSGLDKTDLLVYYKAIVRSILEYACQVWHSGLTKEQDKSLEKIQERALRIILPDEEYQSALTTTKLETLSDRRESMCRKLFDQMKEPNHKLHELLPKKKTHQYSTSFANTFHTVTPKNDRFKKEFLMNALIEFQ